MIGFRLGLQEFAVSKPFVFRGGVSKFFHPWDLMDSAGPGCGGRRESRWIDFGVAPDVYYSGGVKGLRDFKYLFALRLRA